MPQTRTFEETTPNSADPTVCRSLALFVHLSPTYAYLSTNFSVASSSMPHNGLVRFRPHATALPVTPSSTNRSRKRTSRSAPSSTVFHRTNIRPLFSLDGPESPFLCTTSRAW
ncbi:hypothetical protein K443DRAFT_240836 [Laccaria amethystina LaAM-08-1]|uniref:Uncharacterized protein n=1 Tax=Laccaria amethystina LaAM-08-1 TaxID=1095629 RepID=A0A0C9X857_9AGAR|nr:hypothetical protein K443DRAFT_240836 [Laccaria amethystina LaAM-08-1]